MAYVPVSILQIGQSLWKNTAGQLSFNFISPPSTPLDISGWFLITLFVYAQVNGENMQLGHVVLTGEAAFNSPTTTFSIPDSLMTSLNVLPSGNYSYALQGKPLTGDDYETVAQGTLALTSPTDSIPAP
jgi:hypothetical protein